MDNRGPSQTPGFFVAASAHAIAILLLAWNFDRAPEFSDQIETVPVEMVTTDQLNQIMNGEKNAKQMDHAQRRVDKLADLEEHKDAPPTPNAMKDTPPEPTPDKAVPDPGRAEKAEPQPPAPVAAAAPPPPPPAPIPPERPVEKAETPPAPAPPAPAPMPPERPAMRAAAAPEDKPPPTDAEPVLPPVRPKVEPPKHAKEAAKPVPVPHARPLKLAKAEPPPPPPPPRPDRKETKVFDDVNALLDRLKPDKPLDRVASLLDKLKPEPPKPEPPKPVERPRSGNEVKDAKPRDDFNPDKISAMLSHEAPQRKASTGRSLAQVASLGSPTAHAEKLSPTMAAQLDGWLIDRYRGCWSYFGLGAAQDYVPTVSIHMAQDGSLIGEPSVINPPRDPNLKSLADSAVRAVTKCNPLPIPARFRPYYDQGYRQRVVRFDPKEMS